jgi:hypothetical protein
MQHKSTARFQADLMTGLMLFLFSAYVVILFYEAVWQSEERLLGVFGGLLVLSIGVSMGTRNRLCRAGRVHEARHISISVQRYILAMFMVMYGLPKLMGSFFDYQLFALDRKLAEVVEFSLTWYFHGKNKWLELLMGLMETFPGILLLWRRTWYPAALLLLPVTAQVLLVNLFNSISPVTLTAAIILFAGNVSIVLSQRELVARFLRSVADAAQPAMGRRTRIAGRIGQGITLLAMGYLFFTFGPPSLDRSDKAMAYGKLVGAYALQDIRVNGMPHDTANDDVHYKDLYIERQSRWNIMRSINGETCALKLVLHTPSDSIALFRNEGGIGDGVPVLDSLTVFKGTYTLRDSLLILNGVQLGDTLDLTYKRRSDLHPKEWFW